jgi:methylase of polypeptide subunit release factors
MITMLLDDKLFLAPIGEGVDKVLDIGTGTGIWVMYASCQSFPLRSA